MARARNIKPSFFTNENLADMSPLCRLLFIGLWTIADRDGRIEDRPRRIKAELLPYDDIDVDEALSTLVQSAFIQRYRADGHAVIQVVNFLKHQRPHPNESESVLPPPPENRTENSSTDAAVSPRSEALSTKVISAQALTDTLQSSSLNEESNNSDAPHEATPAAPSRVLSTSAPFEALTVLCEATGADVSGLSRAVKEKQLGKAKQLIAAGMTPEDIGTCATWLRSQSWRSESIDMFVIERERGKWELAGKPAYAVERVPNGKATPADKTAAAFDEVRRQIGGRPNEPTNIFETQGAVR